MLKRLALKNVFTHKEAIFDFENGLTAITGPNESGKSLILEMVRYALFGSAALRGSAEDMRRSSVKLLFSVRGDDYLVVRENGRAFLGVPNGQEVHNEPVYDSIASGTTAVNQNILKLLGYGLNVFDVANVANQGQIEALGNMRPADRKRMVDSVIGLTVIDDLIKRATDEAASNRRVVESLSRGLAAPEKPDIPLGYAPSQELKPGLAELLELQAERDELRGWLSHKIEAPRPPECSVNETSEELEAYQKRRQKFVDTLRVVNSDLSRIVVPRFTAEDLELALSQLNDWRRVETKGALLSQLGPKPELDQIEVAAYFDQWSAYDAWKQKERLLAQGHVCCPNCQHEVPIAQAELEDAGLILVEEAPKPDVDRNYLNRQEARLAVWDAPATLEALQELADVPDEMERPKKPHGEAGELTEAWLERAWDQLKQAEKLPELQEQKDGLEEHLKKMPDRDDDLRSRIIYEAAMASYEDAFEKYVTWLNQRDAKLFRYEQLEGIDTQIEELQKMVRLAEDYEAKWRIYRAAEEQYETLKAEVDKYAEEMDQQVRVRNALQSLKVRIKGFLVPSLNKVASILLQEMTGGARQSIEIDEDFEIKVDGQPLNTLSGSGKAVANLAIRIGLGRVLTSAQFSVFMGDELDASMDTDRAGYTAECLRNLTDSISQVVLVSHKDVEADNYIQLAA